MRRMSDSEFRQRMDEIRAENERLRMLAELDAERRKYRKPRMETSKVIAIYLFVLLNAIVVFAMVAMWHFADLSYLGILVSDIAAQVVVYATYCLKAYHAKKQSEQVLLDRDIMREGHQHDAPIQDDMDGGYGDGDDAVG